MIWINLPRRIYQQKHLSHKFKKEFLNFQNLLSKTTPRLSLHWNDRFPITDNNTSSTSFDGHYIYHTAWAARILAKNNPEKHVDISSSLYFSSILSAFIPVEFYDYRPAQLKLNNLRTAHADLSSVHFKDASIPSLSCMHVVEHIGLGRYGDPLDPDGDLKAIKELKRILSIGGNLIFVVPIGKPKIHFNAHRIYSYNQVMEYFNDLSLIEFSLIPDDFLTRGMIDNASAAICDSQNYGCGCFWFKK